MLLLDVSHHQANDGVRVGLPRKEPTRVYCVDVWNAKGKIEQDLQTGLTSVCLYLVFSQTRW